MFDASCRTRTARCTPAAALVVLVAASIVVGFSSYPAVAAAASAESSPASEPATSTPDASSTPNATSTPDATSSPVATPTVAVSTTSTIGYSVKGRRIVLERFGSGSRHVLIVGGIHGNEYGDSVAAKFAAYLRSHRSAIPTGTQIDIVAYANPDGRALKRRSNARKVDLNRNFPASNWTRKHARGTLSHGRSAGSEPETKALMRLLTARRYVRVISLHSRGGVVDPNGKGSLAVSKRIAKAAHIRVVRLAKYPGSMGSYVPEKHHAPVITWELSSRELTSRVRAGLLVGIR